MRFKTVASFILGLTCILFACVSEQPKSEPSQAHEPVIRPVPEIHIRSIDPTTWTEKNRCEISYILGEDTVVATGGIKYRGGISSKYHKHSYTLELDSAFPFLDLRPDDDWIINAGYVDKTFMRHKLSYDLFRAMHPSNIAPDCFYAWYKFNGADRGLYVIMEKVNASMLKVDQQDLEAVVFKGPPVFYETKLEYVQEPENYYQQKFPKKEQDDRTEEMEELRKFLFKTSDQEFRSEVEEWVDLRNVADWHLLLLFTNNSDGLMKNFYLYKLGSSAPFRIVPWDYDHSFGRDGDYEFNMDSSLIRAERNILLKRLMETNAGGYNDLLKQRWKDLTEDNILTTDFANKLIDANNRMIKEWIPKNRAIWPDSSQFYLDDNSYEEEIQIMRDYVEMRTRTLERYFENSN